MNIPPLERSVSAGHLSLEKLATSTQVSDREKVAEVSRQFEAVLLRQILSQAQKPLFHNSLSAGSSANNAMYQDMVTEQLADRISRGGSFGFAKVLEKQLSFQILKKEPAPPVKHPPEPVVVATCRGPVSASHPESRQVENVQLPNRPKIHRLQAQPGKRI